MAKSSSTDLAGEIAYVRSLAEEGRNAPLVGGVLYVIWGSVIGLAALLTYFQVKGALALPFVGGLWFWVAAFAIGWTASLTLGRGLGAKPGALTVGNRTAKAVWLAIGVFMSMVWISGMAFRGRFEAAGTDPDFIFALMFPVAFGLYGIAFYATAVAAKLDWMRGFTLAASVFAVASLYYVGDAKQLLLGAAGSLCCAVVPGALLMRRAPSQIV